MNLTTILAKIARGEDLSEAEKAFIAEYDHQAAIDAIAANARRKSEDRATVAEKELTEANRKAKEIQDALEAKELEGKPELEKLQAENERLKTQIAERDTQIETLSKDKEGLTRESTLETVFRKAGLQFVDKVDAVAMTAFFKNAFGTLSLEDLGDDALVGPIVEAFKSANEAILADTSGHGSGDEPKNRITFQGASVANPWSKDTMNLTLQGQIFKENPALAEKLKKQAVG